MQNNMQQNNKWEVVLMLDEPLTLTRTATPEQFDILQDEWLNVDCTERVFRVPKPDSCTNTLTDNDRYGLRQAFAFFSPDFALSVHITIECWKIIEYCLDYLLASKDVYRKCKTLLENQSSFVSLEIHLLYLKVCRRYNWVPRGMPESTTVDQLLDVRRWGTINSALLLQQWNEMNQTCEPRYLNPCTDEKHCKESIERLRQMNPILFHPQIEDIFKRFGAIIAGGSILSALDPSIPTLPRSDIDIFHNYHYCLEFVPAILSVLVTEFDGYTHKVTKRGHVTTIHFTPNKEDIQPIKPLQIIYSSGIHPKEIVSSFHMDYVRTYFDPDSRAFLAAPEAIISWDSKTISVLNHPCNTKSMAKALYKGFSFSSTINSKYAFPQDTWSHLTTEILDSFVCSEKTSYFQDDQHVEAMEHGYADIPDNVEEEPDYANLQIRKASCNIHNAFWKIETPTQNRPTYNTFPLYAETAYGRVGLPIAETPIYNVEIDDNLCIERGQVVLMFLNPEDHENEDWQLMDRLSQKFDEHMKTKITETYRSHKRFRNLALQFDNNMISSKSGFDDQNYLKFVLVESSAVYLDGIPIKITDVVPLRTTQTFKGFCAFQFTHLNTLCGMGRNDEILVTTRKEVVVLHLFTK